MNGFPRTLAAPIAGPFPKMLMVSTDFSDLSFV
jgi:hypothetical protein